MRARFRAAAAAFAFVLFGLSPAVIRPYVAAAVDLRTPLVVRGSILGIERGYLFFTTGDAVRLSSTFVTPPGPLLGRDARVTIDRVARVVTGLQLDPSSQDPQEIDATALPRDVVANDPASKQSTPQLATQNAGRPVNVTFDLRVPDDTPATDDVYLSTDRTSYNPTELRLNRVDANRWTIVLPLISGATLRYEFTRGSSATVERTAAGGIFTPRTLNVGVAVKRDDVVARWADRN